MRQRVVQLALPVISSPDQRLDLAGARIESDQGSLDLGNLLRLDFLAFQLARLGIFRGQHRVHVLHAGINGGCRDALQLGIEGREDAVVGTEQILLGIFFQQVILDHIHKIGRFVAGDGRAHQLQRQALASCTSASVMNLFSNICVSTRSRAWAARSGCRSETE